MIVCATQCGPTSALPLEFARKLHSIWIAFSNADQNENEETETIEELEETEETETIEELEESEEKMIQKGTKELRNLITSISKPPYNSHPSYGSVIQAIYQDVFLKGSTLKSTFAEHKRKCEKREYRPHHPSINKTGGFLPDMPDEELEIGNDTYFKSFIVDYSDTESCFWADEKDWKKEKSHGVQLLDEIWEKPFNNLRQKLREQKSDGKASLLSHLEEIELAQKRSQGMKRLQSLFENTNHDQLKSSLEDLLDKNPNFVGAVSGLLIQQASFRTESYKCPAHLALSLLKQEDTLFDLMTDLCKQREDNNFSLSKEQKTLIGEYQDKMANGSEPLAGALECIIDESEVLPVHVLLHRLAKAELDTETSPAEARKKFLENILDALNNRQHAVGQSEWFDDEVLASLIAQMVRLSQMQSNNPFHYTNNLEDCYHSLLYTSLISNCFLDPFVESMSGKPFPQVRSGEGMSVASQARKMTPSHQDPKPKNKIGSKIDIMVRYTIPGHVGDHFEALFVEEKARYSCAAVAADRLKLAKSMQDGFNDAARWFMKSAAPNNLRVFGIQTVGLCMDIYVMNAHYKEVTGFHLVKRIVLPPDLRDGLEPLMYAYVSMVLIKQLLGESADLVGNSSKHIGKQQIATITFHTPGASKPQSKLNPSSSSKTKRKGASSPSDISGQTRQQCSFQSWTEIANEPHKPCFILSTENSVGQQVAVKVLRDFCDYESQISEEVLNHRLACSAGVPNVVPLLDVIQVDLTESPSVGMVMPVLKPLNDIETISAMELVDIRRIVLEIGAALRGLHQLHIIHFDVSTANILLDPEDGRAVLSDFGHSLQAGPLSRIPFDNGTPGFTAPESTEGARCFPQSDLYSLGVVLLHLLLPRLFQSEGICRKWCRMIDIFDSMSLARAAAEKKAREAPKESELGQLCRLAVNLTNSVWCRRRYPQEVL